MDPDRKILDAFVDGELPPTEMERIAALLATRPDLDRYVQRQEKLRTELQQSYPLAALAPERFVKAINTAPVSWRWKLRTWWSTRFVIGSLATAGAALAVGLIIGLVVKPTADFGIDPAGQLVAQGHLGKALTTELASNGYSGTGPRIGISYRNKSGADCRTFLQGDNAGLACRESGAWVIGMLVKQKPESQDTDYHMAGSEMPDTVRRTVAADIDGIPFDAADEKAARDRGWSGR